MGLKFASKEIRARAVNAVLSKIATPEQLAAIMEYSVDFINNCVEIFLKEW